MSNTNLAFLYNHAWGRPCSMLLKWCLNCLDRRDNQYKTINFKIVTSKHQKFLHSTISVAFSSAKQTTNQKNGYCICLPVFALSTNVGIVLFSAEIIYLFICLSYQRLSEFVCFSDCLSVCLCFCLDICICI